MVKYRPHILFSVIMLSYLLTRYFRSTGALPSILSSHLTDVFFVPAMCLFALIFLRYFRRAPALLFSWHIVLLQTALISLYFEWYLPLQCRQEPCYVADWYDVWCYFSGALIYLIIQRFWLRTS